MTNETATKAADPMLSANEKTEVAAWKAETKAATERALNGDAPYWMRSALSFFLIRQTERLEEAELKGSFLNAQIAHRTTLQALGEGKRADDLGERINPPETHLFDESRGKLLLFLMHEAFVLIVILSPFLLIYYSWLHSG